MGEGGSGSSMKAAEHEDERAEATNLFFFLEEATKFLLAEAHRWFFIFC